MKSVSLQIFSKHKLVLFPVLVGIVAILVSYFVIYAQITKYLKGREEIVRQEDRVQRLSTKAQELENLDISGIEGKLATSLAALPADRDLANLVGLIQQLATQNGVILTSLVLGQNADAKAKYNPFVVRLEVGGSKDSFRNFVNNVEKAPRVMKVVTLELSPARASNSASASTIIELYFAPTPSELGAIDAPVPKITQKEEEILSALEESKLIQLPTSDAPAADVPIGKVNPFQ